MMSRKTAAKIKPKRILMGDVKNACLWEPLREGDIVDIVAPASSSTNRELKGAIRFVEEFGLVPRLPPRIFGNDIVCSNTDDKRFAHLKKAIQAKDSKIIWSLRGGYGSARLLPYLNRLKPPKQSKIFIGYSDITSLHLYFNYFWQWPTIHGSMLEGLGRGEGGRRELNDLKKLLFGISPEIVFENLRPMNKPARQKKVVRSSIVGGNLTVLMASLGTPWQINPAGKLLMLEDIGERGYRVDRMLVQLEQAGYFRDIKGVIFGDFVGGGEDDCTFLWREVQERFAKQSKFPVLKGLPCGHGVFQRPLPFFTPAHLHLGRKPVLRVKSGSTKD